MTAAACSGVARERGFALLVLLAVIGAASMAIVMAATVMLPPLAGRAVTTTDRVETAVLAARLGYLRNGAFPANLTAAATASGLDPLGAWRNDPYGTVQDVGYGMLGTSLRVRSRGTDRAFGTADDITYLLPTERHLRLRQRGRLRVLRALFAVSPYRTAGTMSAAEQARMRSAMRDFAIAQRRWLGADATTLPTLAAQLVTAGTTITDLVALHSLPSLPVALTGTGGLASVLGVADTACVDGAARPLVLHATLGIAAVGNDRVGGTNDDM